MKFDAWLTTFSDPTAAARAAFNLAAQLSQENAELCGQAAWVSDGSKPPDEDDLLVLLETSDGEVYPGYASGDRWYYADGMPVSSVEVLAWRYLPPARNRINVPE
jgi:hypothetical protein